ncbi:polysaccharide biosynthesis tyrosine autokinase [Caballeronia cordobensis]|uniref:Putative tyrosine-protein kinase EpsB n=1 Tax=Caballeronia cordobensis TaxID=1353886 RepID=A0A158IY61_CABCO|nr:polysaccharide biosynthesis tyrosine autokinase [Caballeronia cordobensis]AET93244.1 exopolysaccharide transport protein family [Burkholderia sp. YI23]AQH03393.1 sugar transporter [Burkholderia sp. KK1]BAO91148.1 exopolysaccharide transport protein family [Burkholderia sp. RPE67]SAL61612.1 tyrosine-protein kinase involved in EPS biosynthesis [Caballeronia cordobensis]
MKVKNQASVLTAESDNEIELKSILETLGRHWKMIAATVAVVFSIGVVYAFFSAPIYQAGMLVRVDEASAAPPGDTRDMVRAAAQMFDQRATAEGEIQVLGSKFVLGPVVDALKLYIQAAPHRFPVIGGMIARMSDGTSTPGLFGRGGYAWGSESIDVSAFDVPKAFEGEDYTLRYLGNGQYQVRGPGIETGVGGQIGTVQRFDTEAGPISLLVSFIHGEKGVEFNLMRRSRVSAMERLQNSLTIAEQGNKSGVISTTLEGKDPVLVAATINELSRMYIKQNADRRGINAEKSLEYLEQQLPDAKRQMEQAEDNYNAYRNSRTLFNADEEGRIVMQQASQADAQLLDLKRRRADLASHFSAAHPSVVVIDQQIAATEKYIGGLSARVKAMPQAEQGALRLQRDVRMSTDVYSALRNNIETMRLIKAGRTPTVELLDRAEVPERPVKPVKALVLVIAAGVGLFLGIVMAFARDFLFKGVLDPKELESKTGLSVFATIPDSDRQKELAKRIADKRPEQLALASRYPTDPAVEGLRMMRASLQYALMDAPNNVVMLAGPLPGIGKSFVSANLATLLAAGGKRVLLVDCDLRRGHLNQYFGLPRGKGLVDIVNGSSSLDEAVHRSVLNNLDFVQCGFYPPDPAELLLSNAFTDAVSRASEEYDIVLLDAPAILAVSDTSIMAPVAGSIFLVARYGDTRSGEISESVKRLEQSGASVTGVLLNGFKVHYGNYAQARQYGGYAYAAYKSDKE